MVTEIRHIMQCGIWTKSGFHIWISTEPVRVHIQKRPLLAGKIALKFSYPLFVNRIA